MSSRPGTAGTPAEEEAYEKRMEALKQREAKVAKKDKELSMRMIDIDRRNKILEETEDKMGTIAAREAQCDIKDKEIQVVAKDAKKREKNNKELEQQLNDKETELFGRETYITSQLKEVDAKNKAVEQRETDVMHKQVEAEESERKALQRQKSLDDVELSLKQREEDIKGVEAKSAKRESAVSAQEADVASKLKDIRAQNEANEKMNAQLQQRNLAITAREVQVQNERDRQLRRKEAIEEAEQQAAADTKAISLKKDELQRRVLHLEEEENTIRKKLAEATKTFNEASAKKDAVLKQMAENRRYEAELNDLRTELRQQETDIRSRERKVASQNKNHQQREVILSAKEADMENKQERMKEREDAINVAEKEVVRREEAASQKESINATNAEKCTQREQANTKKAQLLQRKEKELVEWMKEMEWREMMLGDREAIVDREPVAINTQASGDGDNPNSSSTSGKKSENRGFSNRAFGHAMVEVQLRRLKDQYISSQMKHAREELKTGHGPFKNPAQRHKRLPRAGIAATHDESNVDGDIQQTSSLWEQRTAVHKLNVEFVKAMSKIRAFDGFEDPTSPEKLDHLDYFAEHERTTLCMAANMEYILKVYEDFFVTRMTCPLDEKEKASNVQDLVNRMSKWWRSTKEHMRNCLGQLLRDRERYLKDSLAVVGSKPDLAGGDSNDRTTMRDGLGGSNDNSYKAQSSFDHVRESRILAPRGLATLKAVSSSVAAGDRASPTRQRNGGNALNTSSTQSNQFHRSASYHASTPEPKSNNSLIRDDTRPLTSSSSVGALGSQTPHNKRAIGEASERDLSLVDFSNGTNIEVELALMRTGRTQSAVSKQKEVFDVDKVVPKKAYASPYQLYHGGMYDSPASPTKGRVAHKGLPAVTSPLAAAGTPSKRKSSSKRSLGSPVSPDGSAASSKFTMVDEPQLPKKINSMDESSPYKAPISRTTQNSNKAAAAAAAT